MAQPFPQHTLNLLINLIIIFPVLTEYVCHGYSRKVFMNVSLQADSDWSPAGATWYGSPTGAGSDGGACGYQSAVEQEPFSGMVSAGGPSLFKSGQGCGACYEVKCTSNEACSGKPVTVVITDECAGGPCASDSAHFDLSGTAFGAMAVSGKANQLRDAGVLTIQFQKIKCQYRGKTVAFRVDGGSNPNYFSTLIEYGDGDGELRSVELKDAPDSDTWKPMERSWGAVWKLDSPSPLRPPFSLKLTSLESGKVVVANAVIPAGWKPGQTYRSLVNFDV